MKIRTYTTTDFVACLSVFDANTPQYFAPSERDWFISYFEKQIEDFYVVEKDDKIVACGGVNYEDNNTTGVLSWGMVLPEYQQQGIGTALTKHRLEVMRCKENLTKARVRTAQLTFKFYEKMGFTLTHFEAGYFGGLFDLYDMNMDLKG
jgi:[ribosomal protein S18]-alanine N-acetyltransferase